MGFFDKIIKAQSEAISTFTKTVKEQKKSKPRIVKGYIKNPKYKKGNGQPEYVLIHEEKRREIEELEARAKDVGWTGLSGFEQATLRNVESSRAHREGRQTRAMSLVYDDSGGADAVDTTKGGKRYDGLPILAPFDPNDNAHRKKGNNGVRMSLAKGRAAGNKGELLDYTETSTAENESDDYSLFGGTVFQSPKAWFNISYKETDESAAVGASSIERKRYMDYRGSMVIGGISGGLMASFALVAMPSAPAAVFLPLGVVCGVAGGKVLLSDVGF